MKKKPNFKFTIFGITTIMILLLLFQLQQKKGFKFTHYIKVKTAVDSLNESNFDKNNDGLNTRTNPALLKIESLKRRKHSKSIRSAFLQIVLNVKVQVTGDDNSSLIITSSVLNDDFFNKFESEGIFENWHQLGFNRIEFNDGNEYHRSMSFK